MAKEIECPNPKCKSSNLKKEIREIAVGSGDVEDQSKYPKPEEYIFYACNDCGCKFPESDVVK